MINCQLSTTINYIKLVIHLGDYKRSNLNRLHRLVCRDTPDLKTLEWDVAVGALYPLGDEKWWQCFPNSLTGMYLGAKEKRSSFLTLVSRGNIWTRDTAITSDEWKPKGLFNWGTSHDVYLVEWKTSMVLLCMVFCCVYWVLQRGSQGPTISIRPDWKKHPLEISNEGLQFDFTCVLLAFNGSEWF